MAPAERIHRLSNQSSSPVAVWSPARSIFPPLADCLRHTHGTAISLTRWCPPSDG
jgi:hypothetical protein